MRGASYAASERFIGEEQMRNTATTKKVRDKVRANVDFP